MTAQFPDQAELIRRLNVIETDNSEQNETLFKGIAFELQFQWQLPEQIYTTLLASLMHLPYPDSFRAIASADVLIEALLPGDEDEDVRTKTLEMLREYQQVMHILT